MNLRPTSHPRGMTLLEVIVSMGLGSVVAVLSVALLWQMGSTARRTEAVLQQVEAMETALDRLELDLAYMLPAGVDGFDRSTQQLGGESLRFHSSRFVQPAPTQQGNVELIELTLLPGTDDTPPVLVRRLLRADGTVASTETLVAFDPGSEVSCVFAPTTDGLLATLTHANTMRELPSRQAFRLLRLPVGGAL